MGMYTEIYVNVDLKEDTPKSVIEILRAICEVDCDSPALKEKPGRWAWLFSNGSYYTPNTSCRILTFDEISGHYSLIGKGDIKNYNSEIEDFFEFIEPYCDGDFIGYHRFEENREPTLVYKKPERQQ